MRPQRSGRVYHGRGHPDNRNRPRGPQKWRRGMIPLDWRVGSLEVRRVRFLRLLAVVLTAMPFVAGASPCQRVLFMCSPDLKHPENMQSLQDQDLRARGRSVKWVRDHCPTISEWPFSCDWKAALNPRTYQAPAANTTVLADNPGQPSGSDPPPNRDNAKRGPTLAPKETVDTGIFASEVASAAQKFKLPPQLVRAVMMVESGGNPLVLSNKGAVGLMQLLPGTAKEMGVDDIHDVGQNLMGGARFLRVLANRFDGDLVKVLSAYHAGSTRVLGRDATPFAATDDYVRKVLRLYYQLRDGR